MAATESTPSASAEARGERWPLRRVELLLIAAFWSFLALLNIAEDLLDPRGDVDVPAFAWRPVAEASFENFLWAALTPLVFWLATRFSVDRRHAVGRVALLLGVGVALALFVDLSADLFRAHFLDEGRSLPLGAAVVLSVTRLSFLRDLIIYLAVLAAGIAREYFLRYQARQAETVRLQAHAAQLQAQLARARLEALRMQINPHFLFNTLHAVSSLVERDPRGVRRMIAHLSELLRSTLDGPGEQEVTLEKELGFLQRYMEIMRVRFQGNLEVEVDAGAEVLRALVPNLILQPVVENAIKHGTSRVLGTGRITVRARREGGQLVLSVRDNGPGGEPVGEAVDTGEGGGGVGLRNILERLEQLYGDAQRLSLLSGEEGGWTTEIRLPFHTPEETHAGRERSGTVELIHGR